MFIFLFAAASEVCLYISVSLFWWISKMIVSFAFYLTLEDDTLMQWCVDNHFCSGAARAIRYDDSGLIWQTEPWPKGEYILSEKDKNAASLH